MVKARDAVPKIPHAVIRAKERYGLDISINDLRLICRLVQQNKCEFVAHARDKATVWKLILKDTPVRVIIDKTFYRVITFVPLEGPFERPKPRKRRKKVYRAGKAIYMEPENE